MTNVKQQKTLAINDPSNYPTTKEAFEVMFNEWFDSDEGELVKPARSSGGYTFSDERRTFSENGTSSRRCTITYPNGRSYRIISRDGCHSPVGCAAVGDDCGCDECEAWVKANS